MYWVLHILSRDIRVLTNSTSVQLHINSTFVTLFRDFLFACRQQVFASRLDFNYNTSVVCHLGVLVRASQAYFRFGFYILPVKNSNCLCDLFIFKFALLRHIIVGYTNIDLYERLNFDPFIHTFVHFTIVVLNWCYFTSYSIVLLMSVSYRLFQPCSICFRCIMYVTT